MPEILEIDSTDLQINKDKYILVDVREPHELLGPEGQIEDVILASLGSNLAHFLTTADPYQSYVFVCRSGYRSRQACEIAYAYGFHKVYNLKGGMISWQREKRALS